MSNPLFSITIPVYRTEQFLRRCLDSVLNQTYKDFEVLVIDDCSPGSCKEIIGSYKDSRLRYLRHDKNRGLLQARLTALSNACGSYVVGVDSDDYLGAELLEELAKVIRTSPNPDVVVYQTIRIEGKRKWSIRENLSARTLSGEEAMTLLCARKMHWTVCGKAVKRTLYAQAMAMMEIPTDLHLNNMEDLIQMWPIICLSKHVKCINYKGYRYVKNSLSVSSGIVESSKWMKVTSDMGVAIQLCEAFIARMGLPSSVRSKFLNIQRYNIRWMLEAIQWEVPHRWQSLVERLFKTFQPAFVYEGISSRYWARLPQIPYHAVWGNIPSKKHGAIRTIGICCHRFSVGGLERAQRLLAKQFLEHGYSVIWLSDEIDDIKDLSKGGALETLKVFHLPDAPISTRWQALQMILEHEQIDVCIFGDHWRETHFADIIAAKEAGCRTIVAYHTGFVSPLVRAEPLLYALRKKVYPLADVVTALSPENVALFRADGIQNVIYMPNLLTFEKMDCEKEHKATGNFLFIGRIVGLKGLDYAISAFAELHKTHPHTTLSILGKIPSKNYEKSIKSLVTRFKLWDAVRFEGEVQDVGRYLEKGTALLMCSLVEGAPMVLMEAKSYGLPAVIFSMPYVDSTRLEDGVVSVPYGDCEMMALEMGRMLDDPTYYQSLCHASKQSLTSFSTECIWKRWEAVLVALEQKDEQLFPCNRDVPAKNLLEILMPELQKVASVWVIDKLSLARMSCAQGEKQPIEKTAWNMGNMEPIVPVGHRLIQVAIKLDAFMHRILPRETSLARRTLGTLFRFFVERPLRWIMRSSR